MWEIIYCLIFLYVLVLGYDVFKKKNYSGLGVIVFSSLILNIILYKMNWSTLITYNLHESTFLIIIYIHIVFIIIMIFSKTHVSRPLQIIKLKLFETKNGKKINLLGWFNYLFFLCFFIENYLGSGYLFPSLHNYDMHVYSAPGLSYITHNLFVLLIINYFSFKQFKSKRYIILSLIAILMFLVVRSARIVVFEGVISFIVFYIIYSYRTIRSNKKIVLLLTISVVLLLVVSIQLGDHRMNHYGRYDIKYEDIIQYTGPDDPTGILPWLYGYFTVNFQNLDLSIKSFEVSNGEHTNGFYTMFPIFGIFKLEHLFQKENLLVVLNSFIKYTSDASTVPTGFFEFYVDFGKYSFIPIGLYAGIALFFYNRINNNIFNALFYAIFASKWFLMIFQNTLISPILTSSLVMMFIVYKCSYVEKTIK